MRHLLFSLSNYGAQEETFPIVAILLIAGMVRGAGYYWIRKVYDEFLDSAYKKLGKEGFELMDFYQTTAGRPELPDNTGAHYYDPALSAHFRILANTLCNGGKKE